MARVLQLEPVERIHLFRLPGHDAQLIASDELFTPEAGSRTDGVLHGQ